MKRLFCIVLSITVLGLTNCMKPRVIGDPQTINLCKTICVQHLDSCKRSCTNNCRMCSAASNYTAARNFFKYVHEKQVEGGYITRGLNSYRDPLQCRKVTCNCTSDFITCIQGCTGVIQKQLRSVPYCT